VPDEDLEQRVRAQAQRLLQADLSVRSDADGTWRAALVQKDGAEIQSETGATRDEALQNLAFVLDLGI
jgi:hypothetical protein